MKSVLNELKKQRYPILLWLFLFFPGIVGGEEASVPDSTIQQKNQLKTVIVADYYPYTFVNKKGLPDGFSVDLINAVTKVMGMNLEIKVNTWERARQLLETGAIDLLPMMAYSKERDKVFDFSVPHTIAYDAFFTKRDGKSLNTIEDIKGKTVIVMKGDQAHDYLRSSGLIDSGHLILIKSLPEALRLLSLGQGDAALMPKLVGLMLMKDLNLTNLTQSPVVIESYNRPFSFAVKEGNLLLLERLGQGLSIIKKNGQYREIYHKWFGALEMQELPLKAVLKYIVGLLLVLLLIGGALALWSFSLRKLVALRTRNLESEIIERKRAEESLRQLNRELQAISNCNQTLLRALDEQTLLNEICHIICDEAGYRLAWVGYVEHDEAKTVRPVAWAGFDSGYIADAKLSWADNTERGQGPAGKAIRSGVINYVQDFSTDPKMTPWRENALKRGYRSVIALPLKDENTKVFGAALIYSAEVNAFTPDEIRLLEELASDLAYGIIALRMRAEGKRAAKALEESEAKMRSILNNIGIGVALISPNLEILELNHQMRQWFPAIDPGQHPICYRAFNTPPRETVCDYCPTYKTLQDGLVHEATTQTPQTSGVRNYRVVSSPILNPSGEITAAIEMVEDITEKLSLEAQLRQAQKMESVGRLAGGVAHDFNNMLGVIIGHTELSLSRVDPTHPLFNSLQEIRKAAERSANLTRQLLAFARKQTVAPRVLDLNETVEGMLMMLRRLIGEDIDLAWLPGEGIFPIMMDPSQIDQILANLCVNARDAIAGVGKVTIETHPVTIQDAYCTNHPGFIPGQYVLLTVCDDGCGMTKDILDKLFEPFFTTKAMGKGTGLGLATVYGIVKQNNGFIDVYSKQEHGTIFKIYLPRHITKTEQIWKENPEPATAPGHETILLVEDEPAILKMAGLMLTNFGYRVLAFATPGEAIREAKKYAGHIHLLLSDVVMPEMNGRDLAKNLIALYPGIKCLFMSGYTSNVIAHHGVLDEGVNFIQKPFSMKALAAKVREVLNKK